ncbi:MAG TPA: class I adenylate-forming enzyme family protein [Thermoanaerobaculia bacterium]|nr:class I adenylate-forming enzyme family protein [Thermoanaerobaculia bacterium]
MTLSENARYSRNYFMYEQFVWLATEEPAAAALIEATGRVTSRAELLGRTRALSDELSTAGFAEGDLLAVQLPNSVDFVATWLAALERRLVFVPIDRDAPETEVGAILTHFGVKGLLYRPDRASPSIALTTRPATLHPPLPREARLVKLTSGSTGQPKGIVASEENLIADCHNICSTMQITSRDRNLGAIPFSHSYGFSNLVLPLVQQGTAVVISNDYLPQSIIDLSNHHRCTVAPLIPMVFEHLASVPRGHGEFHSIRTFISAGAPLPPASSRRFRERFGIDIHSFYGCSECGGITYDREGASVERGSVGKAMSGVDLELDGSRLAVRSASVALGYLVDDRTFQPLESGRFVTDDLVEVRESGEIVLTGRVSDLINTAGKKVNPREVEQIILQIEGVRQAKVYGEPAGARGEVVAAAVVANPDLTREQIREFCRERLSLHKVPRIIKLIESIPVDERGKVKRAALALL